MGAAGEVNSTLYVWLEPETVNLLSVAAPPQAAKAAPMAMIKEVIDLFILQIL
jgi:hypothetical protein